jgi:hypothetical protein
MRSTVTAASGIAAGCALLLAAGCGRAAVPAPDHASATEVTARFATGAAREALAARYLAIAQPANRELDHDFDGLEDNDDAHLAAASTDLRAAAATERRFDHLLLSIPFPAGTETIIRMLYTVNQERAQLTVTAATSTSLRQLHGYEQRLNAANEPVEEAVQVIRSQLGLPPPDTS